MVILRIHILVIPIVHIPRLKKGHMTIAYAMHMPNTFFEAIIYMHLLIRQVCRLVRSSPLGPGRPA
jgi:hypothetical protein